MTAAERIKAHALGIGFAAAGIARVPAGPAPDPRFDAWLDAGFHAGMHWIASARSRERRADPAKILPGARSLISVALAHEPESDPARGRRLGRIARYAGGEDYHRVMRDLLADLERFVRAELPGARTLSYADTGAILERAAAGRAGLGWVGKHTGLISPRLGSWLLIGEILLDRELDADAPSGQDHCGTCVRCLEACPTGAIVGPRRLDARLCISYLTIEHRGPIPRELRAKIGDWVFGCDVCQEVCPWNRFAPPAREARLHARSLEGWSLERFLELDEDGFRALFVTSPIRRARRSGFLRNVCVALGNRGEAGAAPALARALATDPDPLVRAHAAWALGEIARRDAAAALGIAPALRAAVEGDAAESVREEARLALEARAENASSG